VDAKVAKALSAGSLRLRHYNFPNADICSIANATTAQVRPANVRTYHVNHNIMPLVYASRKFSDFVCPLFKIAESMMPPVRKDGACI
jgi:hypothetical protein